MSSSHRIGRLFLLYLIYLYVSCNLDILFIFNSVFFKYYFIINIVLQILRPISQKEVIYLFIDI